MLVVDNFDATGRDPSDIVTMIADYQDHWPEARGHCGIQRVDHERTASK